MQKLLCVVPHLSTGGCPQFLVKKIELLKDNYDIHVIEWENFTGGVLVVQRNRVLNLIPSSNFYSINGNNNELLNIINNTKPDIIHFEELPETFIADSALEQIYFKDRTYKIIETTHDSSFPTTIKRYFPDKFLFVSAYNAFKYINSDIPYEVIEYPVEQKVLNREERRQKLGFDDEWKHVINVGLFTPRKNQKYLFEIAEKLKDYKIKFHFIGNQADNFKFYWEPLIQNIPNNCKVWGERSDVEDFIQSADLSFFASKGDKNNKELNPIAIKEVLEYNVPMMLFNLDVYCGKYNNNPNINFLTGDLDKDAQTLVKLLQPTYVPSKNKEIVIIGTFPNTKDRVELTKQCIQKYKALDRKIMLVSHYPVDIEIQKLVDFYFYDKHNPLLHHSYYRLFYNYANEYDLNINLNGLKDPNQSLAVLTNLFNGFKSAKQLGFNKAFYTTYDVILHDNDKGVIDEGFVKLQTQDAYLSNTPNPLGKGVETTAMWWNIDKFLEIFDDVREKEDYNKVCIEAGSENFLEHYMAKKVEPHNIPIIDVPELTHLTNTGRGVQSNSEYFSILPVQGETNKYVIYFYTYNPDNRKVEFSVKEENSPASIDVIKLNEQIEYKKEITYSGKEIEVKVSYIDNEEVIKTEQYHINNNTLNTYKNTGFFKHKKKPKIKLIHLQTTNNDEREQISREQLSQLKNYGIEYVLHQNQPYKSLPPSHNCSRPDCVSMTKFEEGHPLQGQALTPPHYGCFTSFRDGIISEFDKDLDFLIVCEGDCLLEVPHQEFVDKVYQACGIVKQNSIDYFSFGDTHTLEEGWFVSGVVEEIPNQDLAFITNKIIGIQCIMFPQSTREFLVKNLLTHPWDAADLYFNIIFNNKKMGILKNRITTQVDGYSLIDKSDKSFRK
jgi:glycosyltransferase involved in cell wall biosynthesis